MSLRVASHREIQTLCIMELSFDTKKSLLLFLMSRVPITTCVSVQVTYRFRYHFSVLHVECKKDPKCSA